MTRPVDSWRFNGGGDEIALAIVRAVAAYANKPPIDLPPLNRVADPDALEVPYEPVAEGELSFSYADYRVHVSFGEEIGVEVAEERN